MKKTIFCFVMWVIYLFVALTGVIDLVWRLDPQHDVFIVQMGIWNTGVKWLFADTCLVLGGAVGNVYSLKKMFENISTGLW